MEESGVLVLEILKQSGTLAMSVFEQEELAQTVRRYSQLTVSFDEIDKLCQDVVSVLNKASCKGVLYSDYADTLKKTGQVLWDHLFTRSVKDRLKTTIIKYLLLSIDEELINIPWELLYDGNEFLCLKFNLGRLVRTKDDIKPPQYRSATSIPKMLILANPTADLKSAYQEGLYIKNQFDRRRSQVSIDFKSTNIDTLYVKKNLRDYDIVHFAGHCEYDRDDSKNSGWLLSDGVFGVADIMALGESPHLPSIVFSNACHSAKAAAIKTVADYHEKNYNLASAFLFSGVRHYIGTIWKIEDPVSLVFAREFYAQLIKGGSVGECIRLSRLRLIKEYGIASISWASYLLYGNPNFILFRCKGKAKALKLKRDVSFYRKRLIVSSAVFFAILLIICLCTWLPTSNPSTYLSFRRSKELFYKGDNQGVVQLCSRIIDEDPLFLASYPLMADACQRLGDRVAALRYYFDYALYSEKKHDKKHQASAYIGIGWIYQQEGEYPKAFDFYNKAILLSKENGDRLNEAAALRKLAVWHIDKGENDKALELLMKSSEINRERQEMFEHRYNLACDYFDMALVLEDKNDYAAAKEFYDKSRRLFERLKLKNELSDYYFNLGEISIFEKQYQKAMDYYMRGLSIDELKGDKPSIASDYSMIGELYLEMDDLDKADKFLSRSILISKQINARPELASAYYDTGLLYKKKGQKDKARDYFRSAQEIYSSIDTPKYQEIKQELLELDD